MSAMRNGSRLPATASGMQGAHREGSREVLRPSAGPLPLPSYQLTIPHVRPLPPAPSICEVLSVVAEAFPLGERSATADGREELALHCREPCAVTCAESRETRVEKEW